jgi:hypothetical protein
MGSLEMDKRVSYNFKASNHSNLNPMEISKAINPDLNLKKTIEQLIVAIEFI